MSGTQVTTLKFKDGTLGFGGGFSISTSSGGIFKYTGTVLETDTFIEGKNLMAYPNPTSNLLTIKGKNITEITIFDMAGKQVMIKKINTTDNFNLDVSSLSSGIYLLNASNDSGLKSSLKFSKQ